MSVPLIVGISIVLMFGGMLAAVYFDYPGVEPEQNLGKDAILLSITIAIYCLLAYWNRSYSETISTNVLFIDNMAYVVIDDRLVNLNKTFVRNFREETVTIDICRQNWGVKYNPPLLKIAENNKTNENN